MLKMVPGGSVGAVGGGTCWEEIARRGKNHAVLFLDPVMEIYRDGLVGATLESDFTIDAYRQLDGARWMCREDIEKYVTAMQQLLEREPTAMLEKVKPRNEVVEEMRKFASHLDSNVDPRKSITEFLQLTRELWLTAYHYIILNKFYPDQLMARIAQCESNVNKQNEILRVLLELPRPTEIKLEKQSLLKIAGIAKNTVNWRNNAKVVELVDSHLRNFAHLNLSYYWGAPYSQKDIFQRIENSFSKPPEEIIDVDSKTKEILDELNFGSEEQIMVETLRQWGFTANYADETFGLCVYRLRPAIKQVCKEWRITYNQFCSMRICEIESSFANGFDETASTELARRFVDNAFIFVRPELKILTGENLHVYKQAELKQTEALHSLKSLTGQSICPGLVIGKAKLVNSVEDANELQKGEILIAPATIPPYVSAMERSAAIVTNEGGFLCHAAIVARELKVPCVVGTKIATKVFRNGDLLEVDASNGHVRKL